MLKISIRIFIVLALVAATVFSSYYFTQKPGKSEPSVKMELPEKIGDFTGEPVEVSESEIALLPDDTEFAKMLYTDSTGNQVSCQIVLAGADQRSIHRPEVCLPGQGWRINSSQVIAIPIEGGRTLRVMELVLTQQVPGPDGKPRTLTSIFNYWFVGNGLTTPSHLVRRLHNYRDLLLHNINHRWAYMIVSGHVTEGFAPNGKSFEETQKMLRDFIAEIAPQIIPADALAAPR